MQYDFTMSQFAKSHMTVNGNAVNMSMPFAKVNVEKRTVSGYATLDNLDSQGDIVTAEASLKAFSKARGNLREMHDKIAVGRIIDFREDEYFDKDDGQVYRGIYVTAYVSKGAENTWEKVLDGTLTGFSIGGEIVDASTEFVKEAGRTVRFVKDYDLTELSLVDNPANQKANIMSIAKVADGSVNVEGMVAETVIESVFICKKDDTVIVKAAETHLCPVCDTKMENAGWFESGPDRTEKVKAIVTKFLSPNELEATPASEGGVEEMTKKKETKVTAEAVDATSPDANEEADREPKEVVDEEAEAEGVEAVEVEEVDDDSTRLEKKFDEWTVTVKETLEQNQSETLNKISTLEKELKTVHETFEKKTSELERKFEEFGTQLTAAKATLSEFEKTLEVMNKSAAGRKSAELSADTTVQKSTKSIWGGTFSGESLFK